MEVEGAPAAGGSPRQPLELRHFAHRHWEVGEGGRAQRLVVEVGSRRTQVAGKGSLRRTASPGSLWPGVPRAGWPG